MEYPNFKVCCRCFTFNQAKFITDTMNGFTMQQTSFPFVCTIVDDASTDGEQEVIRKYVEDNFDLSEGSVSYKKETDYAHIIYAQHKTNENCYFAVLFLKENHYSSRRPKMQYLSEWRDNVEYEALCEGDDYWIDCKKIQTQYDLLNNNSKAMMSYSDYVTVNEFGKKIHRNKYEKLKHFHKSGDILPDLFKTNFPLTCTVFIRKVVLVSELYINMPARLDYGLFLTAASMGDCLYVDRETSCYRNNPNSMMNTKLKTVSIAGSKIFKYYVLAYLENRCKKESLGNNIRILYTICKKSFSIKIPDSRDFFISICKQHKRLLFFIPFVILQRIYAHIFVKMPEDQDNGL